MPLKKMKSGWKVISYVTGKASKKIYSSKRLLRLHLRLLKGEVKERGQDKCLKIWFILKKLNHIYLGNQNHGGVHQDHIL